ncbi:hypothetical protein FPV67DRAFT_1508248 [Lyophyllum atratum]|nr:hypothetical protein FPV67DRAFT_1508248 [Lyophyllum atratum]
MLTWDGEEAVCWHNARYSTNSLDKCHRHIVDTTSKPVQLPPPKMVQSPVSLDPRRPPQRPSVDMSSSMPATPAVRRPIAESYRHLSGLVYSASAERIIDDCVGNQRSTHTSFTSTPGTPVGQPEVTRPEYPTRSVRIQVDHRHSSLNINGYRPILNSAAAFSPPQTTAHPNGFHEQPKRDARLCLLVMDDGHRGLLQYSCVLQFFGEVAQPSFASANHIGGVPSILDTLLGTVCLLWETKGSIPILRFLAGSRNQNLGSRLNAE